MKYEDYKKMTEKEKTQYVKKHGKVLKPGAASEAVRVFVGDYSYSLGNGCYRKRNG